MPKNSSFQTLPEKAIGLMAARFRALGEVSRPKLIFAAGNREKNVSQLIAATGSTQANVSKHLALLAVAGILKREKDGQCVYYGMKDKLVVRLCELVRAQIAKK